MKFLNAVTAFVVIGLSSSAAMAETLCPDGTPAPNDDVRQCPTTPPNPLPEPGSFALLAIGAGAGAAAFAWSRRRDKK